MKVNIYEAEVIFKLIKGWKFQLSQDLDWSVFLGTPGVVYPTLTPQSNRILSFFTLERSSQTTLIFFAKKHTKLRRTKPFQHEDSCQEGSDLTDYIKCEKKCFLKTTNVRSDYLFNL